MDQTQAGIRRTLVVSLACASALCLPRTGWAFAFSALGLANFCSPQIGNTTSYSASARYSGGASVEVGPAGSFLGLEVGALWLPRAFKATSSSSYDSVSSGIIGIKDHNLTTTSTTTTTWSDRWVQVPVMAKLNFSRFFSAGLGVYYARPVGDISVDTSTETDIYDHQSTITTQQSKSSSSSVAAHSGNHQLGATASLAAYVELTKAPSVFGGLKYDYGLTKMTHATGESIRYKDSQLFAGLRLQL